MSAPPSPGFDSLFAKKIQDALEGTLPVYFAAVPLALCVPYDLDYRPDLHPAGTSAILSTKAESLTGKHHPLIVYQRGIWFVVSDDYIPYFAALSGLPDYVPCYVLGKPNNSLVQDVQGPIAQEDVSRAMGI